jgi:hypothetical protein
MGLMQDVDGNLTNPIQATKKIQHVVDIHPWRPCVLPKAIITSSINPVSLLQTIVPLQPRSCTPSLVVTLHTM